MIWYGAVFLASGKEVLPSGFRPESPSAWPQATGIAFQPQVYAAVSCRQTLAVPDMRKGAFESWSGAASRKFAGSSQGVASLPRSGLEQRQRELQGSIVFHSNQGPGRTTLEPFGTRYGWVGWLFISVIDTPRSTTTLLSPAKPAYRLPSTSHQSLPLVVCRGVPYSHFFICNRQQS
jgi:hypothetical protein